MAWSEIIASMMKMLGRGFQMEITTRLKRQKLHYQLFHKGRAFVRGLSFSSFPFRALPFPIYRLGSFQV
jgi:hypothetical protein